MSDAEIAYRIAEERIEKAVASGPSIGARQFGGTNIGVRQGRPAKTTLSLSPHIDEDGRYSRDHTPELAALDRIPSEIGRLNKLESLHLHDTQVADIAPLAGMQALEWLELSDTQVADLRPVAEIDKLIDGAREWSFNGLHFRRIPATRLDPEGLGRLAEIEDNAERTEKTLAYLKSLDRWPPDPPDAPAQEEILRVAIGPEGAEVAAALPDAQEQRDAIRRACHRRLREAAADLARAAGNRHARLAERARALSGWLDGDLADLDLLEIHLELELLRGVHDRRGERTGEDALTDDEVDALANILTIGPGLVRENDQVEAFDRRVSEETPREEAPELDEAENALMRAARERPDLFGPMLRAYATRFEGAPRNSADGVGRSILSRNTLIAIGTAAAAGVLGARTDAGFMMLVGQWQAIQALMESYGAGFAGWMQFVYETARVHVAALPQGRDLLQRLRGRSDDGAG